MNSIPTLLRIAEHAALSELELSGKVIDLGGEKDAAYLSHIKGSFTVTAVNLDADARPDIAHDLEDPLPVQDGTYDHALLINVLEHVYRYRELLGEAVRVTRPGGVVAVIVPFFFPVHPSPRDYWRFTAAALEKELAAAGLTDVRVKPLGSGVFAARYVALDRLLPMPFRFIGSLVLRPLAGFLDQVFVRAARVLGKKYQPSDYALGYLAYGVKPLP